MLESATKNPGWSRSPMLKAGLVGFLIALLMIPLGMVMALIHEREETRAAAELEVSSKWGSQQVVGGPVLIVPYRLPTTDAEGRAQATRSYASLLPQDLTIEGNVAPELRYRGIFEVPLYAARIRLHGSFVPEDLDVLGVPVRGLLWSDAVVSVGIPDPRGIRESVRLHWDDSEMDFEPGAGAGSVFGSGIHASLGELLGAGPAPGDVHTFELELSLNGSRRLAFLPLGQDTRVRLDSSWPDPSFTGAFLPGARDVSASGFRADWQLFYLGRSYPQQWRAKEVEEADLNASAFGVELLLPVDEYLKSMRSAKYGILFLVLTFGAYFLFEVLGRLRIHPFQYLLIGMALVVFYVLLLSLSEHLGFDRAYAIAASATVGLIAGYSGYVLGRAGRIAGIGLLLGGLYLYLYVLLQLADFALLLGALGLFFALAAVMWITRRVDWYALHE